MSTRTVKELLAESVGFEPTEHLMFTSLAGMHNKPGSVNSLKGRIFGKGILVAQGGFEPTTFGL